MIVSNEIGADTRYFSPYSFGLVKRNLTFNGTQFKLNGVQNKAVFSSLNNLSDENLEKFSKIVSKNLDLNEIKTSSKLSKNYELNNEISFKDKVSGNTINLKLNNENLERLKTTFGSKDFDKGENGQITLKGNAESFVSGWFGDIAYKRNYVGADADKNGFLNESEKSATLAGYGTESTFQIGNGSNVSSVDIQGVSAYLPYNKHYDAPLQNTIEKELNATLKADTNMDGYLNLGELQSKEQIIDLAKKNIEGKSRGALVDVFETLEQLLQEMSRQDKETLKKSLDIDYEKQLNAENYANADEALNALDDELKSIQKISVSFKVSEEVIIKNLDNANFTNDLNAIINEIKQQTTNSLKIDISA